MSDLFDTTPNSFEFKCLYCEERFSIHFTELAKDSSIICPNCKHRLNEEAATNLQLSVQHLHKALDILYESNTPPDNEILRYQFTGDGFQLRIKWPELRLLPEKHVIEF